MPFVGAVPDGAALRAPPVDPHADPSTSSGIETTGMARHEKWRMFMDEGSNNPPFVDISHRDDLALDRYVVGSDLGSAVPVRGFVLEGIVLTLEDLLEIWFCFRILLGCLFGLLVVEVDLGRIRRIRRVAQRHVGATDISSRGPGLLDV